MARTARPSPSSDTACPDRNTRDGQLTALMVARSAGRYLAARAALGLLTGGNAVLRTAHQRELGCMSDAGAAALRRSSMVRDQSRHRGGSNVFPHFAGLGR